MCYRYLLLLLSCLGMGSEIYAQTTANFWPQTAQVLKTLSVSKVEQETGSIGGLSGLAWDEDDQVLRAVSDRGSSFAFSIERQDGAVSSLNLQSTSKLQDENGELDGKKWRDAEGLDLKNAQNGIKGDTELIVAFERRPRLWRFSDIGELLERLPLADFLSDKNTYVRPNLSLETVASHPQFGWLTAAEVPFDSESPDYHVIYTQDGKNYWRFQRLPYAESSLTGMIVMDDSTLLILERAFTSVMAPFYIGIRRLSIDQCDVDHICRIDDLLVLNNYLHSPLDNFEGLARLDQNHVALISDDNESNSQQTLLMTIRLD